MLFGLALVNAVPLELCIDRTDLVQSAFQFTCQDCPRNQMQPFGIGNTAGFELWIAAAQYSSSERI